MFGVKDVEKIEFAIGTYIWLVAWTIGVVTGKTVVEGMKEFVGCKVGLAVATGAVRNDIAVEVAATSVGVKLDVAAFIDDKPEVVGSVVVIGGEGSILGTKLVEPAFAVVIPQVSTTSILYTANSLMSPPISSQPTPGPATV